MSDKNKFNEDELRRKIREQLEQKHSEKQIINKDSGAEEAQARQSAQKDESYFLEVYIRRQLQEEVFSRHAEFIKCGNHLDQVKWLTPLELEEEFEFFPYEYTRWEKLNNKFSFRKKIKVPDTPEIKQMIDAFRKEIEDDATERIARYKAHLKENQKHIHDDLEKKIFEEEQERFYKSKKGYHKYKNHIDETAWMTREEFDAQDEFTDRVFTPMEKLRRNLLFASIFIGLVAGVYFLNDYFTPASQKGFLLVELDGTSSSSLYLNQNLAIGFTPGTPYLLEVGEYEVTIISAGYKIEPAFKLADISVGDTTRVAFDLLPLSGNMGIVRLDVPFKDALIYVDGAFKGTAKESKLLALEVGDHSITVKKDNYIPVPQLHTFSLNMGDTIDLSFRLSPHKIKSTARSGSAINVGLIAVNANVRGAQIILNGQRTGFTTDYILQKIPFGQHIIRVEKEGYKIYPAEQVVKLAKNKRQAKVNFTMTSTSRLVNIFVEPRVAKIFIDGQEVGTGNFSGPLSLGTHKISFEDLAGYIKPEVSSLEVRENGNSKFEFKYGSALDFLIKPGQVRPSSSVQVSTGYIMTGINFKANSSNGPDIVNNKFAKANIWNMGFAFQYKNPPGNDAVLIRFRTPADMNITKDVKLKLWLYDSKEKYPLILGSKAEYRIVLNNVIIADHVKPKYLINELAADKYEAFSVSQHLRAGINVLLISVTSDNARFLKFWKAEIN